ncbi:MAG: AAA family ATPase, partial [Acidobacteriota bacterium]
MTEDQNDGLADFDLDLDLPDAPAPAGAVKANPLDNEPRFDCAGFVARHQLARLVKTPRRASPGLQLVVAPADAWRPVLAEVAHEVFQPPRAGRPRPGTRRTEVRTHDLDPSRYKDGHDKDIALIERDLMEGRLAIAITSNLPAVPLALRNAADRIIMVPPPDSRCLAALVHAMGHPSRCRGSGLQNIHYEAVTPATLRLAYRGMGTAPRAFLKRLKSITSRPAGAKATSLDRLHGIDEVKRWACSLKADLDLYRQGKIPWRDLSRGLLLSGPPGTGKTSVAAAIAGHCGITFIPTSYASWQSIRTGHLGDVLKGMTAAFSEAREKAPAVLFIDELDSLPARGKQGQHDDWWRTIVNALLEQIDGATVNEGVVLVAATNDPHRLDPAILRSGRLEDRIDLHPPGAAALEQIYADQLAGDLGEDDLKRIATISTGRTGADVVRICASARRQARGAGRPVRFEDLLAALGRGSDEQADGQRNLRVAIHEIGHALAALDAPALRFHHVTVLAQADASGGAVFSLRTPQHLTEPAVDDLLSAMLAGRAAEEIILGDISSGSGGREGCDLSKATQLAAEAQLSLGIHSQGLLWYPAPSPSGLAGLFTRRPDIEKAVRRRLDKAYTRAKQVIETRAPLVRHLAEQLLVRKALTADELIMLMKDANLATTGITGPP